MTRRNIGFLNNNWKGGHRRDEVPSTPLTARDQLVIEVTACLTCLRGVEGFEDTLTPGWTEKMQTRLAKAERALDDYDEQTRICDELLAEMTPRPDDLLDEMERIDTTAAPLNLTAVYDADWETHCDETNATRETDRPI